MSTTLVYTRPVSPDSKRHPATETTPLLVNANAGPSSRTSRKQKKGSRAGSSRNRGPTEGSECSYSDVESLTRQAYSTCSNASQSSTRPSCSHAGAARSQSPVSSTSTCDGGPKACVDDARTCLNDDDEPTTTYDIDDSAPPSHWSFVTSIFTAYDSVSLTLENSGSVARDHLASERTFLAYMRTSLAIASAGVALVQLFSAAAASMPEGSTHRMHAYVRPLGASAIGMGIIVLLIGFVRYFKVQAALTKGYFPVSRITSGLIAMMLSVLVTVTFAILLSGKLEPRRH